MGGALLDGIHRGSLMPDSSPTFKYFVRVSCRNLVSLQDVAIRESF
jgi:hypothetical protein